MEGDSWLLLIHQLPPKPPYLRVKVWRRLQALGAVPLKNSVYVLPSTEQTREDFEWVLREIQKEGAEASLCEARLIDGLSDHEVRGLFLSAREADYRTLGSDIRKFVHDTLSSRARSLSDEARSQTEIALARFRKRLSDITQIDFFAAPGREAAEGLIVGLEERLVPASSAKSAVVLSRGLTIDDVRKRTWVTRKGVHIDRVACAWLIRRFIDPEATFKFVQARGYTPDAGELRFDMYDAEFTHDGDLCTFEVMLRAFALKDPALHALAEVIHDIDLKDAKFKRPETAGVDHLIAGIAMANDDDDMRLSASAPVWDGFYEYFRRKGRERQ